jgi:hypothetical protein
MCNETGVPLTTLYSQREQVPANAEWQPSHEHFEMRNRPLPDDVEAHISRFVRSNCMTLGPGLDGRARAARRREIGHEECTIFMIALKKATRDSPAANIVNFNESNWRLGMASE